MTGSARRYRSSTTQNGVLGAVGWLFAELALVLVVVAIGAESPVVTPASPSSTAPPASPSSPAAPPAPTTFVAPEGLSLTTAWFTMAVPASGEGVLETFNSRLTATVGPNGRVGLILLFGVSRNPSVPTQGTVVSGRLKEVVEGTGIPQLRSVRDIRAYLGDSDDGAPGDVRVELFLLNGPS